MPGVSVEPDIPGIKGDQFFFCLLSQLVFQGVPSNFSCRTVNAAMRGWLDPVRMISLGDMDWLAAPKT